MTDLIDMLDQVNAIRVEVRGICLMAFAAGNEVGARDLMAPVVEAGERAADALDKLKAQLERQVERPKNAA